MIQCCDQFVLCTLWGHFCNSLIHSDLTAYVPLIQDLTPTWRPSRNCLGLPLHETSLRGCILPLWILHVSHPARKIPLRPLLVISFSLVYSPESLKKTRWACGLLLPLPHLPRIDLASFRLEMVLQVHRIWTRKMRSSNSTHGPAHRVPYAHTKTHTLRSH